METTDRQLPTTGHEPPTDTSLAADYGPPPDWQNWPAHRPPSARRKRLKVAAGGIAVAGVLLVGAAASVFAADPSPSPSASVAAPGASTSPGSQPAYNGPGRGQGMGGPTTEAVTDASIAAGVIGISESDLVTALNGGQSTAAVAKAHNVDVQKVIDALVADKNTELDAAVKAGTLTQAQADAEKAEATQFVTDQVNGTGFGPGGLGGPGGRGGPGHGMGGPTTEAVTDTSIAAGAIGISEADLVTALKGGQSMAAVAKAHNVDGQKVIDALVADKNTELDAAVKAGTLTQAEADAQKAQATQFVTDQVNGTFANH